VFAKTSKTYREETIVEGHHMSQRKSIAGSSLLVWIVAAMAASALGAADRKTEHANWENVKQLNPGQEIKVVLNDVKSYRGRIQTASDDAIVVRMATGEQTFKREDILRVSSKGEPHRGRNAAIAAGIGAGVGAGLGYAASAKGDPNDTPGAGALGGALVGALLGGVTGTVVPTGGWHDVYRAR
jgi:hypothetical protein